MRNLIVRSVYRVAHLGLRVLWYIRRPETTGALVAVWHRGRILLVRNSYRRQLTLPGGYIRPHEERPVAAARELEEEVGVVVSPSSLKHVYHGTHPFEHRKDTLDIFEVNMDLEPAIQIDHREVVWASFEQPDTALKRNVVPHLREYLQNRTAS